MRAGPLSDARVIALLNRAFVCVYAVNEDYRPKGCAPDEEKADYRGRLELYRQGRPYREG